MLGTLNEYFDSNAWQTKGWPVGRMIEVSKKDVQEDFEVTRNDLAMLPTWKYSVISQ
jgi:hypothetical protein